MTTSAQPPRAKPNRSSRNSTPLSSSTDVSLPPSPTPTGLLPYLGTSLSALLVPRNVSIENLIDDTSGNPPSATVLGGIHDGIFSTILTHVTARGQACDRSMRELARKRKTRAEAERADEQRRQLLEEEKRKRQAMSVTPQKRDHSKIDHDAALPAVGAHGLAPQDGSTQPNNASADATSLEKGEVDLGDVEIHHQPIAAPAAQYQSFGDDPTQYNDPTVYGLRDITPDMSEREKKEILCVADYPHDDLYDQGPGTPIDDDYSNAKPTNQVTFSTFISYVDPYVRQLTEEDVAFLKERTDRVQPYLIPARGTMHYRQVWAKEDGGMVGRDPYDGRLPPNQARGSISDMNDELATTEDISSGPLLSRLLQAFRHEPTETTSNNQPSAGDGQGDISMTNGDSILDNTEVNGTDSATQARLSKPSSYFPELASTNSTSRPTTLQRTYASLEQRMLQELRYHGLLTPEASPEYDGQYDDEVAERLRFLQAELRTFTTENALCKARVLELTEERMAMQEYATIADDLDNQINAAYTKRNRSISRPKKGVAKAKVGQGSIAGIGLGRNTISEGVRMLMERRTQWKDLIGPCVDFGQMGIPKTTVFDKASMDRLARLESEVDDIADES